MNQFDIKTFLKKYTGMSFAPCYGDDGIILNGVFDFKASSSEYPSIKDSFIIEIFIPNNYPKVLPIVREIGNKIPRNPDFHIDNDGVFCLGSNIGLLKTIHENSSILIFAIKCIVPYLYAVSLKIQKGIPFVFGELQHGSAGLFDDYKKIFNLKNDESVIKTLACLCLSPSFTVNKRCPCGCGKKLKKCRLNIEIKKLRRMASKDFFYRDYKILVNK